MKKYDTLFVLESTLQKDDFLILESKFPHHNVEYLHEHFDEPESHIGGYRNSGSIIFI